MQTNLTLILPTTQFTVSTHVTYDGTLAWFRLPLKLRITSVHAVVSEVLQSAEESCAEKKNEKVDEEKLNDEHQRKSKGENLLSNHFAPFISYAYVLQFDDISSLKSFKTNPSLTVGQDIDTGLTEILEELEMSDTEKSDDILKIESKLLAVLETDLFDQESVKKAVESLIEVSEAVKEL